MRFSNILICHLTVCLFVCGCGQTENEPETLNPKNNDTGSDEDRPSDPDQPWPVPTQLTYYGFNPSDTEAQTGLDHLWAGDGFRNGFPTARLERLESIAGIVRDTPTALATFEKNGSLPSPSNRPGRLESDGAIELGESYFWREDAEFSNRNCFLCHAGVSNGSINAGQGNSHLDQASSVDRIRRLMRFRGAIEVEIGTLVRLGRAEPIEEQEIDDFFLNAAVTVEPTLAFARSRGDNFGPYAVWSHLARLADPVATGLISLAEDERTDRDDLFAAQELVTVDPSPWWLRRYRTTSYWYGENAENISAHFAFNFTTPHADVNETHEEHVMFVDRILDFADNTTSPPFPGNINGSAVQRGRAIFHGETKVASGDTAACSGCHGTYSKIGADWEIPGGWSVDYEEVFVDVGTDPSYRNVLTNLAPLAKYGNGVSEYFTSLGRSDLAPSSIEPANRPLVAPPLVGVWASAPYFHNGSVPTLYHVLNSTERPDIWERINDDWFAYNLNEVGLACRPGDSAAEGWRKRSNACTPGSLSTEQYDSATAMQADADEDAQLDFRGFYATHLPGRSNAGHTFGDILNDAERYDVIAFLTSLSGPNMPSKSE